MSLKRNSEIDLLRIGGVQVALDYSWLVIFVLVFWSLTAGYFPKLHPGYPWAEYLVVGIAATVLFFSSVLVHELSHAFVANRLGHSVRRISLFIFGGMAHMESEPASARDELYIAGVGPLTSLVLGALFWSVPQILPLHSNWPMWASVFEYLGFINLALAVFNLLPGFPLDGGRILRAALWARWNDFFRATERASDWGKGIAYGLIGLGAVEIFFGSLLGGLWLIFIALFLKSAAQASYQNVVTERLLGGATVRRVMAERPITIEGDVTIARAIDDHFLRYGYGGFPVVDGGRVAGIISLSDIRSCPPAARNSRVVSDFMRPLSRAIRITPDMRIADALRQMGRENTGRLLVMENENLVGMVSRSAITRYLFLSTTAGVIVSGDMAPDGDHVGAAAD
jgi:Zn-dependent protease/CBS domain-containing protein